ncbi:MAG TPA: hypothetical protein ENH41_03625 [Candidatus Omnitrophica bacterium]|nr:hypothetical protein [Candidatus Omnitrophota bacterium]
MIDETLKNRIILIISILCLIFFFAVVGSTKKSLEYERDWKAELRKRMELEEQNINYVKEKVVLESNNKQMAAQFEKEKKAHEETKKFLVKEQSDAKSANEELEKLSMLKDTLEENLKEALIKNPNRKKR